ncbi:unnamed protein product [Nyctereutes procyonoides]|uniref:(raccoon dog) hypothetical protein n=1 Tax=Nyctereutes procyonoides TaxID=34880 RepID=A0A811YDS3_NYCPR|nr:unnamed protein product [Nyctereutes procyonoides]
MPKDDAEPWGHHRILLRPPSITPPRPRSLHSCSRAHEHPYGPPPAATEESLSAAEVNSSEGLGGWRLKEQDSMNVSQEFSGSPPAPMMGGQGAAVGAPRDGFFPPRGPQVRAPPPHIPTIRSGNTRKASKEGLAHGSFPQGSQWHPTENWSGSLPFFSPFLAMPIAFAPPPILGPLLPSYFANFPPWGTCTLRENQRQ